MAYISDPTDITQPIGSVIAQTAAAEFRALKAYIQTFQSIVQRFSATDHAVSITITGGGLVANKTAPTTAVYAAARTVYAKSSGKWYWEIVPNIIGGVQPIIGIATVQANIENYIGSDSYGYGYGGSTGQKYIGGVGSAFGASFSSGDVIGFALDLDANELEIFKNNVSQGTITGITVGAYYPAISMVTASDSLTANFDSQTLVYAIPAGYSAFYNSSAIASNKVPVRQTVLSGPQNSSGLADFLTAGTGLAVNLVASPSIIATIAAGFTNKGAVDNEVEISGTQNDFFSGLAASNKSFIGIDNSGTAFKTLAPIQYGTVYNKGAQAVLQFAEAAGSTTFLDDFGNTWAAVNQAIVQINSIKFGVGALGGNGASNALSGDDAVRCLTPFIPFGADGWSIRGWVNPSTLPGVGVVNTCFASVVNAGFGALLAISNVGGSIKFAYLLSSNGTSFDITAGVQGTTTPVVGTYYFVELTYDRIAGVYRLYVNGAQEASTASASRIYAKPDMLIVGANATGSGLVGYIDKPEFLPYCEHPAGTAYSVPTAAPDITTDGYSSMWFDTVNYVMNTPSAASTVVGSNPTFVEVNKIVIGEVTTDATVPTSMISYAYQGNYKGAWITPLAAVATLITINHNIGVVNHNAKLEVLNLVNDIGYTIGQILDGVGTTPSAGNASPIAFAKTSIIDTIRTGATGAFGASNGTTGAATGLTAAAWAYRITAVRSF